MLLRSENDGRATTSSDRRAAVLLIVAASCVLTFWTVASVSDYFLDAPYLYMVPEEWSNNLVRSGARFPNLPEAALSMVASVLLLPGLACAVWAAARLWEDPVEVVSRRLPHATRMLLVGLALVAALAGAAVAFVVIRQTFLIDDERSYAFQAALFAEGRLALPSMPAAFRNPMILVSPWMAKYPPGLSALLVPGVLFGVPHLIPPLVGAALVLSMYGFVREAFGERQGLLAAGLLAVSPFLWCNSGTLMSFTAAALAVTAAYWAFARARRDGRAASLALSGACLGFCLNVRPFDALTLGAPLGVWLLADAARAGAHRRFGIVPFAAGFAPFAAALLLYNQLTLGHPLRFGYTSAGDYAFGFYMLSMPGYSYFHTPAQGIAMIAVALIRLDTWLFGWPGAVFLVFTGALVTKTAWDRLVLASVLTFVLTHTLLAATGTWDVGPTYYFPVVPLLVVMAVRALRALREAALPGSTLRRAVGWLPLAGACLGFVTLLPLRFLRLSTIATEIEKPWKAIAEARVGDAIVVLPSASEMASAVYSLGYPYRVASGDGSARLIRPHTEQELEAARDVLGRALPVYVITLDRKAFRDLGVRNYTVKPWS